MYMAPGHTLFIFYHLLIVFVRPIYGASTGAKDDACVHMFPGHSAGKQTSLPPYKYSLSSTKYGCVSNITITLYTNEVKGFKGFLCQTRRDLDVYITYGTLSSKDIVNTANKCDQTGSISHSNPSIKSSVTFKWTPPEVDVGDISIICTVVKEFSIFWINVVSPKMTYSACPTTTQTNTPESTSLSSNGTYATSNSTGTSSVSPVSSTVPNTTLTPVHTTPNTSKSSNISSTSSTKTITSSEATTTENMPINSASLFSVALTEHFIILYSTQLYLIVHLSMLSW